MLLQALNGFAERLQLPAEMPMVEVVKQDITVQVKSCICVPHLL